ncbi:MAG TPA: glycosyl hydrolase-related protein [Luteibacter sp.]|nr:glycosyl hydrolase-related protein [Luteibacter sp.]
MKRRDLLKSLTLAAGAATLARPDWRLAAEDSASARKKTSLATPIRGLMRKNDRLVQPIRITLGQHDGNTIAITRLDGVEIDRRAIERGAPAFDVHVDTVEARRSAALTVTVGSMVLGDTVDLRPVRKMLVYILPHSHHDLGYTDLQADVEEKQMRNIASGIALARKTAGYPEGSRFVWNLEVLWGADLYLQRKSEAEKADLIEAIQKGWIALNGAYANELTGLCRPEELLQLFRFGIELGKRSGTRVDAAMISDVPGYTWGTVTAMAQAGIRYFSSAPNYFDRIGRFMATWQDKPFWWMSRSGKEKVLFWVPWTGYAMSHVMQANPAWVGDYQERMDEVNFPYDISYIRWSGHGDNAEPDPDICEFTKSWNEAYEWPKFAIASTSTAFAAFEKRYGNQLPKLQGDLTPYWEDGAASSARETGINRNTADRLTQAAALAAMTAPASFSPAAFGKAWRNVLLYSEHTWGAAGSVTEPEAPMTTQQWATKRAFADDAERQSLALLDIATRDAGGSIDIANTTSWDRKEIVMLSPALSAAGDHVVDRHGVPLPSQRLSSGELALLASVPAFGVSRYTLSAKPAYGGAETVTFDAGVIANASLNARIDPGTGDIVALCGRDDTRNLVDEGLALNTYLYLAGDDVARLGRSGPATIVVEDHGPLVVTVRIASTAPGCRALVRRVRLCAGQDFLELVNIVDKLRAPLESVPGKPAKVAKESVQFAFPFAVTDASMNLDIPFARMQPETDQLPGSCKNWLPVGRWIDVSNDEHGVTWTTLDAPLVEVGGITATKLNSQTNPDVWLRHLDPSQTFYSWAMNNHWGTNYRAWQEGPVTFRYALRPHRAPDPAQASRFATALTQPLLAMPASRTSPPAPFLGVEPADVLVEALKPSEDGNAWIVRLFGASGKRHAVTLHWSSTAGAAKTWLSNLAEDALVPADHEIAVDGWALVTLRIERD